MDYLLHFLFLLYALPRKSQALCRKFTSTLLLAFSVSFCRCLWYTGSAVHPRYLTGEGVEILAYLMAFLVAVAADVVGHIICKWLDRYDDDRKPN